MPIRKPCSLSITEVNGIDFLRLHAHKLPRPYANWVRLLLLLSFCQSAEGSPIDFDLSVGFSQLFGLSGTVYGANPSWPNGLLYLDLFFGMFLPHGGDSSHLLHPSGTCSAWTAFGLFVCSWLPWLWLVLVASLAIVLGKTVGVALVGAVW